MATDDNAARRALGVAQQDVHRGHASWVALGIADSQALTQAYEAVGASDIPVVVYPRSNVGHPAFAGHVASLRAAGAIVLDRSGPGLPWSWIREQILAAMGSSLEGV